MACVTAAVGDDGFTMSLHESFVLEWFENECTVRDSSGWPAILLSKKLTENVNY